jgi:hypothetical protein
MGGGTVSNNLFLVYTNPMSDEQDAEFNDWYTNTHLGEIVALPGIVSATRYRVAAASEATSKHRYLAIYELEDGVTPEQIGASIAAGVQSGQIHMTDAIKVDTDPGGQSFWECISERVTES